MICFAPSITAHYNPAGDYSALYLFMTSMVRISATKIAGRRPLCPTQKTKEGVFYQ